MRQITVSGKTYYAALDPKITNVPVEEDWPEPTRTRRGNGYQFHYPYGMILALRIATHLEEVGESFVNGDDPMTRAEGRACLLDAQRIRARVAQSA